MNVEELLDSSFFPVLLGLKFNIGFYLGGGGGLHLSGVNVVQM